MQQVNPGIQYPIYRVLRDTTDTSTHYVRAVIKNASTNATLDTIDLTDKGSRIFTGTWETPYQPDPLYVVIITTVYDDSAYTTVSANYSLDEADYILVEQKWSHALGGGGGGGANVDYKKIAKLFAEAVAELPKPVLKVPKNDISFAPLIDILTQRFVEVMNGMPKMHDMGPMEKEIKAISAELKSRPRFEPTDLSNIERMIDGVVSAIEKTAKTLIDEFILAHERKINFSLPDVQDAMIKKIATDVRENLKSDFVNRISSFLTESSNTNSEKKPQTSPAEKFRNLLTPMNQ